MEGLRVESKNGAIFFNFNGEITLEVTADLKNEIEQALEGQTYKVLVFDLAGVNFMDSSGIGFLVAQNTKVKGGGKRMYLYRPSAQVKKTLDLVQLSNFFQIIEDEDALETVLPE